MALVSCGCTTAYSPPIRSSHGGAPGRIAPGEWQLGGSVSSELTGGPTLSVPVADAPVHAEAGSELRLVDEDSYNWALGFGGIRYTKSWRDVEPSGRQGQGVALDMELGAGVGAGGTDTRDEHNAEWEERLAGGGYSGVGFGGFVVDWFALWLRTRLQVSAADAAPTTAWLTGLAGAEFDLWPVALYGGVGAWGYGNDVQTIGPGLLGEGGMAIHLDFDRLEAPPREAAARATAPGRGR
jgi:hypothetical protein